MRNTDLEDTHMPYGMGPKPQPPKTLRKGPPLIKQIASATERATPRPRLVVLARGCIQLHDS